MSKVRLAGATSGYTEITAPAVAGNNTVTLPSTNGAANQLLKNGATAGSLEFASNVVIDSSGIVVSGITPVLKLEETDGTSTHSRCSIARDNNTLVVQTRSSADAFVSTDYFMPTDASGATSHAWNIAGAEGARLTGTGLGIGTNTPSHRLEVARLGADQVITSVHPNTAILATAGGGTTGSGAAITLAGGTASNCGVFFGDTADGDIGGIIYNNVDNSLTFRANAVNQGEFTSGNLFVLGGITPNTAVDYSVCTSGRIESDATYSTTTAAAANMVVDVNGLFIRSTSSIKYKTDVEDAELSYSEAIVYGSRPVWYRSLSESDPSEYGYWGFIAEEVAEIDPRMVHWGNDGPEGVQYDRYVVHLVGVIQKQQQRLDALESRLAALEAN